MFERLLPNAVLRHFMTPLGLELEEALDTDEWRLSDHTLEHKSSGIHLWIANGYMFFRIYRAANITDEDLLQHMLNRCDRCVVWRKQRQAIKKFYREQESARTEVVLNTLRLGRIKEAGENT